jgi:hypothetical protein
VPKRNQRSSALNDVFASIECTWLKRGVNETVNASAFSIYLL